MLSKVFRPTRPRTLPVHKLYAVVKVGDALDTHRLGESVLHRDVELQEVPQLGHVVRLRPPVAVLGVEFDESVRPHVGGAQTAVFVQRSHLCPLSLCPLAPASLA